MKQVLTTMLLLITAVVVMAAASPKDVKTINAARKAFNKAIAEHDLVAMKKFLAEDYVITISDGSIERSRDAHINSFAAHFKQYPDVKYTRNPTGIQTSEAYPLAIEHGTWVGTRTTAGGPLKNGGEYTAAWRRTENGWVIYSELFVALYCDGEGC